MQKVQEEEKTRISFSLSWVGLFVAVVMLLVTLIWAFILGVLVGRGYQPERYLQRLKTSLPGHSGNSKGLKQAGDNCSGKIGEQQDLESKVLGPDELDFFTKLKKQSNPQIGRRVAGHQEIQTAKARPSNLLSGTEDTYHYLYQVASFIKKSQAQSLVTKLTRQGMNAELEEVRMQDRQWFRVLVYFKGRPSQTRGLKRILQGMGIDRIVLRKKKKVSK